MAPSNNSPVESDSSQSSTDSKIIKWGLSGFGPRHALYLIHQAMILLAYENELEANNVNFQLHYTVFEKQGDPEFRKQGHPGVGNAFQKHCDATVNTPVTPLPTFLNNEKRLPHLEPETRSHYEYLEKCANLERTMYPTLKADYEKILTDLKKRNPAAAAMFKNAFESPDVANAANVDSDTLQEIRNNVAFDPAKHNVNPDDIIKPEDYPNTACMTRGKWGTIQEYNIKKALGYIKANIPKIQIDILYSHEVVGVDFDDPEKPVLIFKKEDGTKDELAFDFVSFAHGTRLVSSVRPNVALRAYEETPNHDTMRTYLKRRGVLKDGDDSRIQNNEKKIAITGLGLAFYDYATLLLAFLPGIDQCEDPIKFLEEKKTEYQGLITVISHGKHGPAPPRNALDSDWKGGESFFSARNMHALRLQRNSNWLPIAYEFLEAHIAHCRNKVPDQVNTSVPVEDFARRYKDDISQGDRAATETGLLRAGYAAFSSGTGIVKKVDDSEKELVNQAPLSRSGRFGYPMYSASCYEISSEEMYDTNENTKFFERWTEQMFFNFASPTPIQDVMNTLFTTGIAKHEEGSYEDIGFENGKFTLRGTNASFDALLSPKKIDLKRDSVFGASVKELIEGVPNYGKGGHFQNENSVPIHAFDAGTGSSGTQVRKDGGKRTAGVQTSMGITNGHKASSEWAVHKAYQTLALAVALCNYTTRPPIEVVENTMWSMNHANAGKFEAEVKSFEPDWVDLQDKLIFLRLAAYMAGNDAALYRGYINKIFEKGDRDKFIADLAGDAEKKHAEKKHAELESKRETFKPPTMFEFERRFPDYTKLQYEEILQAIVKRPVRPPRAIDRSRGRTGATRHSATKKEEEGEEDAMEYPEYQQGAIELASRVYYDRDYNFLF